MVEPDESLPDDGRNDEGHGVCVEHYVSDDQDVHEPSLLAMGEYNGHGNCKDNWFVIYNLLSL